MWIHFAVLSAQFPHQSFLSISELAHAKQVSLKFEVAVTASREKGGGLTSISSAGCGPPELGGQEEVDLCAVGGGFLEAGET